MRFEVRGIKGGDGVVTLDIDARDLAEARRAARSQGMTVVSARARALRREWIGLRRKSRFPLVLFAEELQSLLEAGLNLVEALEALAERSGPADSQRLIKSVLDELYEGKTFSRALSSAPLAFPPLFVSTVRAAEKTGDLARAVGRYVAYERSIDVVRKKVIAASIYPIMLLAAGGLVTLFLLGYVVPRFSAVFAESGRDLPFLSKLLLQWGQAIEHRMGTVVLAGLTLIVTIWMAIRSALPTMQTALWRIPAVGSRLLVYQLARFYRTVGMLLEGGTPVVSALEMAEDLLSPALRPRVRAARNAVREGHSLSEAMRTHGLTTSVAARMIDVGERSGNMAEMMDRIARFFDGELARWIDMTTRLFEPLLMAVIGVIIGAIVVLMYLPIFELAGGLQ